MTGTSATRDDIGKIQYLCLSKKLLKLKILANKSSKTSHYLGRGRILFYVELSFSVVTHSALLHYVLITTAQLG